MIKTHLEIDLDQAEKNAKVLKEKYSDYKYLIGVLKSNAYGHGEYIVNALVKGGINYIAVSYIEEALKVRKYNKDIPILCLQPILVDDLKLANDNDITITINTLDYLRKIISNSKSFKLKVHIKLDTGMNRLGFKDKNEVKEAVDIIKESKGLILEGIYSHFATVGMFTKNFDNQVEEFKNLTSLIDLNKVPIVHFGSSVITISHKKLDFCNATRVGIALYGYNVSLTENTGGLKNKLRILRNRYYQKKYNISPVLVNQKLDIKPCISMYTRIIEIKDVKKDEYVGYGATYKALEDIKIAILPIGYYDGIGSNNNHRFVLINGKKYYAVGSMAMNMMAIKIDETVKIDDKVCILGEGITPRNLALFDNRGVVPLLLELGKTNSHYYLKKGKIVHIEGEEDENK